MERGDMYAFFKSHKGKVIGVLAGLLFGMLVLMVGFWRSVFLAICMGVGYFVGSLYDGSSKLRTFFKKFSDTM